MTHNYKRNSTGMLFAALNVLEPMRVQGLLETDTTRLRPTLQKQRFLNDLLGLLLPVCRGCFDIEPVLS